MNPLKISSACLVGNVKVPEGRKWPFGRREPRMRFQAYYRNNLRPLAFREKERSLVDFVRSKILNKVTIRKGLFLTLENQFPNTNRLRQAWEI